MDKSKSLQELEGYDLGDPKTAPTNMIRRCMELHRTPLEQWGAEDCRLMLGQKISPHFLIPIALKFLADNPMEGGTMFDGALLLNILRLPDEFWMKEQKLWWHVREAVTDVKALKQAIEDLAPQIKAFQNLQNK